MPNTEKEPLRDRNPKPSYVWNVPHNSGLPFTPPYWIAASHLGHFCRVPPSWSATQNLEFGIHAGNLCKFIVPLSVLFQVFLLASIFGCFFGACLLSKYCAGGGETRAEKRAKSINNENADVYFCSCCFLFSWPIEWIRNRFNAVNRICEWFFGHFNKILTGINKMR